MTDNTISLQNKQGQNAIQSQEVDDKENKLETSMQIGSSWKANSENPKTRPSNLTTVSCDSIKKSDFGPLSPVQLNIGSKPINKDRAQQKKSRQENKDGTAQKQKSNESKTKEECSIAEFPPHEKYIYEEGVSLIGELAIFADEEEEKQLRKIMTIDQNKNQSNIQRLNTFVGDLLGKFGPMNPSVIVDGDMTQPAIGMNNSNHQASSEEAQFVHDIEPPEDERTEESISEKGDVSTKSVYINPQTNDKKSPISEPKSKYWETLMLQSEEPKDTRYEFRESLDPTPQKIAKEETLSSSEGTRNQTNDKVDVATMFSNNETPRVDKKVLVKIGNPSENEPSPQSMISIPMDYSPGDGGVEKRSPSREEGVGSREESSPGSLMFNMISAATNVETPLVCKTRQSILGKSSMVDSSPAASDFGNMASHAATAQTPELGMSLQNKSATIKHKETDLENASVKSAKRPTHDADSRPKRNSVQGYTQPEVNGNDVSKTTGNPSSCNTIDKLVEKTPVKSNKTAVFRPHDSDSSLQSDCDDSEDGSIYTSLSYHSSIQSNTPRSRRVVEWLDPNVSNTVSWPTPSMTTNIRSSDTPERQLPTTKYNEKSQTMGTGQYLTLQKHIRSKSKSAQKSDWRLHRPLQVGNSISPTSLPSLLGSASCNEVSDLESPTIINFPLNFKFSDEESTLHSQSVHESSEVQSIPGNENRLHSSSPQSLMTVATQTQQISKIYCIPGNENRLYTASPQSLMTVATPTVGYPTDEERSYDSKSPKHVVKTNQQKSRAVTFSIPANKGSGSPHSTNTDESFKHDMTDDKFFRYSKCLRRCIIFGMVVALVGSITVLVIAFSTPANKGTSNKGSQTNRDEDWKIEIWPATSSPTSDISLPIQINSPTFGPTSPFSTFEPTIDVELPPTQSPVIALSTSLSPTKSPNHLQINSPTFDPTSPFSTFEPTVDIELPPTQSPVIALSTSSSPTKSPNHLLHPTTSKASFEPTAKPTAKPTSKPMTIPTFSSEEIKDLTWHRIINGENIWRNSDQTPVWFFAADSTSGIKLNVINAAKDDRFLEQLQIVIDDYSRSKAVSLLDIITVPYEVLCAPPEIGEIKVCSGDYGDTDWIGSTILFMRDEFIVSALIRINESSSALASNTLLQYELCHQVGHSLGVVHNDADLGLSSCMKDFGDGVIVDHDIIQTNQKLQHPNSDDLDYLVTLYGPASRMLRGRRR